MVKENQLFFIYSLYYVSDECGKCRAGTRKLNINKYCKRDYGKCSVYRISITVDNNKNWPTYLFWDAKSYSQSVFNDKHYFVFLNWIIFQIKMIFKKLSCLLTKSNINSKNDVLIKFK